MSNKGKNEEETLYNGIVGKNIRYLRKRKKLTQTDIAKTIQVSFQQVQKYEKGLNGLHSHNLHKIAHRVFGMSMDDLADPQMITNFESQEELRKRDRLDGEYKYWEHQDDLENEATTWINKHPKKAKEILGIANQKEAPEWL